MRPTPRFYTAAMAITAMIALAPVAFNVVVDAFDHNQLVDLDLNILEAAVMNIVAGMNNSTNSVSSFITLNVASANVTECPTVNAVTRIRIFFQSPATYMAHKASTKRI